MKLFSPLPLLCGAAAVLFILWLPGINFPVVSDTLRYADLGKSLWTTGTYMIDGVPYASHLPFHGLVSYPLTVLFGIDLGMHFSTYLDGVAVLVMTYFLMKKISGPRLAAATTLAVLVHPGFILMTQLGSADLLFTALSLFSIYCYLQAENKKFWYLLMGLSLGCACLTRYNGLPLFALFGLWTLFFRRKDLFSPWFVTGFLLAAALAGSWFLRNALVFGNPFHSEYVNELSKEAPNPARQFFRNILYYANPIHNVFPALFPFAVYGLWGHARKMGFVVCAMLSLWVISSIWWVEAIRFFFPGYPFLLLFAVLGMRDAWRAFRSHRFLIIVVCAGGIAMQLFSMCIYTYGACNAFFDRTVGIFPKNMGLTPEGFYAWGKARDALNALAESGAQVMVMRPDVERRHYRSDLKLIPDNRACPAYYIAQRREIAGQTVFETESWPKTYVVRVTCP